MESISTIMGLSYDNFPGRKAIIPDNAAYMRERTRKTRDAGTNFANLSRPQRAEVMHVKSTTPA